KCCSDAGAPAAERDEFPMLSAEQNELITRTGHGTPAGALMRRYWQPAALVDELAGNRRSSRCGSWVNTSCSFATTRAATVRVRGTPVRTEIPVPPIVRAYRAARVAA